MKVIMPLNTWANMCGYFFNAYLDPEEHHTCNNGYNCRHPEQDETDINPVNGHAVGMCYSWSCPLAYSADGLGCQRFGVECEDCGNEECECYDDMMVCEIPKEKFDERYMWREAGEETK